MVDSLLYQANKLKSLDLSRFETSTYKCKNPSYGVVTLHRPSNVDNESVFAEVAVALRQISTGLPLIFPVHRAPGPPWRNSESTWAHA